MLASDTIHSLPSKLKPEKYCKSWKFQTNALVATWIINRSLKWFSKMYQTLSLEDFEIQFYV